MCATQMTLITGSEEHPYGHTGYEQLICRKL